MADLPPARLRLYKPAFYSTRIDCFGPFIIKIGRRTEKRWGIIFKCLTTHGVHLDLLEGLDADSFLMSIRRFIARRGKPHEIFSDRGTNFRGGDAELRQTFSTLDPVLTQHLAKQEVSFHFNPPNAPHFGGVWEREIKSVKNSLWVILGARTVTEPVLRTVLIEVEGILNSKPLGYVSSDVADIDPVTPAVLLMGCRDASLPQVVYPDTEPLLGRSRWRHSQILADHFWLNFIKYYLPSLQLRQKWQKENKELTTDYVVLIVDSQLPRAKWPVGKVMETFPGPDGRARTARIQVRGKSYIQPLAKLIWLPKLEDNE